MLEFEHIIQVNDLNSPNIKPLSREQLWQGLWLRAKSPEKFNPALQCRVEELTDSSFYRFISAGDGVFKEQVEFVTESHVHTQMVDDTPFYSESSAIIEEPEPGALFIRFRYKRELDNNDNGVDVGEHLKSAYTQIDKDAIALIRAFAERESLNQSIN